jgi:hypothetical protein
MNIISKEELMTLNQRNGDLELSVEQIKYFLNHQHSLGKILYFDQEGLDHFIIRSNGTHAIGIGLPHDFC